MRRNQKTQRTNNTSAHDPHSGSINLHGTIRRWPSSKATTGSPNSATQDMNDSEDLIEDDYDSYDELFTQHFTGDSLSQIDGTEAGSVPQDQRRPTTSPIKTLSCQGQLGTTTDRFCLPKGSDLETKSLNHLPPEENELPWAQRYAPVNLEELAVHKRKVRDVEQWLNDAFVGRAHRGLLVIKGPAGSGKTTTVSLLSKKLNFDILEWKTPSTSEYATKGYISLGAQFDEFLSRGHKFGSLDVGGGNDQQRSAQGNTVAPQRRVILIEEFPTLSGRNFSAITAFRLSLLRHFSMNATVSREDFDPGTWIPPIIMVITETLSTSETSFDNLTVHRLLGRDIYNHPSTTIIEFNSIAPTFMAKALNFVLEKHARHSDMDLAPVRSILDDLSETGDVRNAVASLEFVCLSTCKQVSGPGLNPRTRNSIRKRKKTPATSKGALKHIGQREPGLGLFHAVGKVVYNKRDDASATEKLRLPCPPEHLRDHSRPGVSQVNVNELLDETGNDAQTFICTLHENYVLSCSGSSFTECVDSCIEALSDSDILSFTQEGHSNSQAKLWIGSVKTGAGVDLLRQHELSYQVAARGLLFSLPYPVKRQTLSTNNPKRTIDAYKLSFPPAIRLLRHMEEVQGLIDSWAMALLGSSVGLNEIPLTKPVRTASRGITHETNGSDHRNAVATVTMISRGDLILHQLPYMALILSDEMELGSLRRITDLSRLGSGDFNQSSQQDEGFSLELSSKKPLKPKHTQHQICWDRPSAFFQAQDERYILSDDDIVDDP
ncbi:Rad17 cell cycle checkpoint protein-domain-containing protein [Aspergillus egyptiacus]|nr:Rad17 cell cycle checkpoint protein-domain-containing protein [Aspergillus egyptiacus]